MQDKECAMMISTTTTTTVWIRNCIRWNVFHTNIKTHFISTRFAHSMHNTIVVWWWCQLISATYFCHCFSTMELVVSFFSYFSVCVCVCVCGVRTAFVFWLCWARDKQSCPYCRQAITFVPTILNAEICLILACENFEISRTVPSIHINAVVVPLLWSVNWTWVFNSTRQKQYETIERTDFIEPFSPHELYLRWEKSFTILRCSKSKWKRRHRLNHRFSMQHIYKWHSGMYVWWE